MSMNVFFFFTSPLSWLAGAKVQIFFYLTSFFKLFLKKFSKPIFNMYSELLLANPRFLKRFADGKDKIFTSYKPNLFLTFFKKIFVSFFSIFKNSLPYQSGCKSSIFFYSSKLFETFFYTFFESFSLCLKNQLVTSTRLWVENYELRISNTKRLT